MNALLGILAALPLFTAALYLSTVCPIRPACFFLSTPKPQTLFCESRFVCTAYRFILLASTCVVLSTVLVSGAYFISSHVEIVDYEEVLREDAEQGWSNGDYDDEDTDCEDDIRDERYRD